MNNLFYIKNIQTALDTHHNREVLVTLNNGTEIHIGECYESWEQWGGTRSELATTVGIADAFNDWLHGDVEPDESEYHDEVVSVAKDWLKENLSEWCKDIDCFDARMEYALNVIDKDRTTLRHANDELYRDMQDALETWCADNGYDAEDFDIEYLVI